MQKERVIQYAKRGIKIALVIAIVGFMWSALSTYVTKASFDVTINWSILGAAVAMCISYRLINANGWQYIMSAFGAHVPRGKALQIWLYSEAARWLPGSLCWAYDSRAVSATKAGVRPPVAGANLIVELILTLLAWGLIAVLGVPFLGSQFSELELELPELSTTGIVGGLVVTAVSGLMLGLVLKQAKQAGSQVREALSLRPNFARLGFTLCYYTILCAYNGLVLWVIMRAFGYGSTEELLPIISANAIAWLIGFFAVFAPGGLMVREGALVLLLCSFCPSDVALTVSVSWRILQIVCEASCVLLVWSVSRLKQRRQPMETVRQV